MQVQAGSAAWLLHIRVLVMVDYVALLPACCVRTCRRPAVMRRHTRTTLELFSGLLLLL